MKPTLPQCIVVLGPTASGKSSLAIALAKEFSGEIISADSRQIYIGMDIGTAKESKTEQQGIAHHGIDLVHPNEPFSVADFQRYAYKTIGEIITRGNVPIIVGGSSLYVSAVIDGYELPGAKPNPFRRKELEAYSEQELAKQLAKIDSDAVVALGDRNKRYLIRAIEIAEQTQSAVQMQKTHSPKVDACKLGIEIDREKLYERINMRVDIMMKNGLVEETQRLRKIYSADLPAMSSIGYAEIGAMLDGEILEEDAVEKMKQRTRNYAKRQLTWWRKDNTIHWVRNKEDAMTVVRQFL